ncbi:MAG: hypothetical protein ABI679_12370, partial [Gemmatimonadota bacterium]
MALSYPGRTRIVSRPGLEKIVGPPKRQLVIARWLPIFVPLGFQALSLARLHFTPIYFFITAVTLWLSARAWSELGMGLGLLVLLQLLGGGTAMFLLGFNLLSPQSWLTYSA